MYKNQNTYEVTLFDIFGELMKLTVMATTSSGSLDCARVIISHKKLWGVVKLTSMKIN